MKPLIDTICERLGYRDTGEDTYLFYGSAVDAEIDAKYVIIADRFSYQIDLTKWENARSVLRLSTPCENLIC